MSESDLREELHAIASGMRAHLELLRDSGAEELPMGPPLAKRPAPAPSPTPAPAPRASPPEPAPPAAPPAARSTPVAPVQAPRAPQPSMPRVGADPVARRVRLEQIETTVSSCTRCPLHSTRTNTVFARGNPDTELMFIGEGPGADEDAQGLPFVGKAGQLLDKMIEAMGYAPADVYIANVVKCRPPGNRKPEPPEMEACEGYLHEQIALVSPKVIVALGATAVEGLLKVSGITRLRGTFRLYRGEIPVMPTFHPAYLLRTPAAKREVWSDLKQVMKKLGKTPPAPR